MERSLIRHNSTVLLRQYGVPVIVVALMISVLVVATVPAGPLSRPAEAQVDPTPARRHVALVPATATATPWVVRRKTPTPVPTAKATGAVNIVVSLTPAAGPMQTASAPGAVRSRESWSAESWKGGYYRGDGLAYGRQWTAVYGAASEYPRSTLTLSLTDDPSKPVRLFITGLDDELVAKNRIRVEVNGQRVYEGESWFPNWDGNGSGANAGWKTVQISIPPELLMQGTNRITIRNMSESANFGQAPYLLLASVDAESDEEDIFGKASLAAVEVVVIDGQRTMMRSQAGGGED
jgi:hypothetical protein